MDAIALTRRGLSGVHASPLPLQLCSKLANAKDATGEMLLPTFDNPEQPNKRVDLRRLLLNKCQIEFEKGIEADTKVKAREEKEIKGGGAEVRARQGVMPVVSGPSSLDWFPLPLWLSIYDLLPAGLNHC